MPDRYSPPFIIVAVDSLDFNKRMELIDQLNPELCRLKIGKAVFTQMGPEYIRFLQKKGFHIFLDLKYHDIPETVAQACIAASALNVWMLNVHALGGAEMIQAARKAIDSRSERPLLIAVTLLTSLNQADCLKMGLKSSLEDSVLRLAEIAYEAGAEGVVCSPHEVRLLRKKLGKNFCLVTPGIRWFEKDTQDQKRSMTPESAIQAGSDYIVIGRPITQASSPQQSLIAIYNAIEKYKGLT